MDQHLSPAETAKRFGISNKALRLYEKHGLLKPLRTVNGATGAGWRVYGPEQFARLLQILALKRLGLSLKRIGELLGDVDVLEPILAFQERVLVKEGARIARALALIRMARTKLATGEALSIDDLAALTQETVMIAPTPDELKTLMLGTAPVVRPITEKYLTDNDRAALKQQTSQRPNLLDTIAVFFAEAGPLMEAGDPLSEATLDWARRWGAFRKDILGSDPGLKSRMSDMEKAIKADTTVQDYFRENAPFLKKIGEFMEPARDRLKAQDKEAQGT